MLIKRAFRVAVVSALAWQTLLCFPQAIGVAYSVSQLELPDILAGIIHYTRWPVLAREPSLQLCLSEHDRDASAIVSRFADRSRPDERPVTVSFRRLSLDSAESLQDCQVIYFGDVPVQYLPIVQDVLAHLSASPILTIGQGEEFCARAGLFCLMPTPRGMRISANLDSIARSGLRVNPRLLKMTVHEGEARP